MKQEALTFPEAVKTLAEKANIRIDTFNTKEKSQGTSTLYEVNEKATRFFTDILLKTKRVNDQGITFQVD
jgi:DNA primase